MRVSVDQDACVGAGRCALAVPEVFDQRPADGVSVVVQPAPPPEYLDDVRAAAQLCPAMAIRITEEASRGTTGGGDHPRQASTVGRTPDGCS